MKSEPLSSNTTLRKKKLRTSYRRNPEESICSDLFHLRTKSQDWGERMETLSVSDNQIPICDNRARKKFTGKKIKKMHTPGCLPSEVGKRKEGSTILLRRLPGIANRDPRPFKILRRTKQQLRRTHRRGGGRNAGAVAPGESLNYWMRMRTSS